MVAYERWSLTRGSSKGIWLGNFWYCGKLVAEERWSLTRDGRLLQEVPNIVIWLGNFRYFGKLVANMLGEVVAYGRWSLTRGSKYNDLTWKLLVFWKTGR